MRVAVHQPAVRQQRAVGAQRLDHGLGRLEHVQPAEQRQLGRVEAVLADRVRHLEAVPRAELEIVGAVRGRDVHEARALLGGDEIGRQHRPLDLVAAAVQRMAHDRAGKLGAFQLGDDASAHDPGRARDLVLQRGGDQQPLADARERALARLLDLEHPVVELVAIGHGAVARDGPGRRGPDHRRGAVQRRVRCAHHRKAHGDRGRGMVVILDLGIGERGLLDHRPHHRLLAAVELAGQQELRELAEDPGLGRIGHGGVGTVPVADHAQALELAALDVDPVLGELAAFLAELGDRHGVLVEPFLAIALLDLPLDRQAVAVPARHVDGVQAQHLLAAIDHVLQDLVEGRAHVQVAVGVGRPVVQDEFLAARGRLALAPVEVEPRPALQELRLTRRQVGPHREIRARQEHRAAIVFRRGGRVGGRRDRGHDRSSGSHGRAAGPARRRVGAGVGHELERGSAKTVTGRLPGNEANHTVPVPGKDRARNSPLRELRAHGAKIGIGGWRVKETPVPERHRAAASRLVGQPPSVASPPSAASTVRAWMQSRAIWIRRASTLSNRSSSRRRSTKAQHSHWP